MITRFSFVTDFPSSGVQALGENGNDGEAAEKWLAEQAQVGKHLLVHLWPLSDYLINLIISDEHFHLDSENHFHSGPRFG